MAGSWDGKVKRLIGEAPQDFVSWLLPDAVYQEELSPHLQSRGIDTDILYLITLEGEKYLFHVEFQRHRDPDMAERVWEYNMLATRKFHRPIYSFVIYLKKDGQVATSPLKFLAHDGSIIHLFVFQTIKLWDIPTETLLRTGYAGLLPLAPLTQQGKSRAVVEQVIDALYTNKQDRKHELLALTYGFASLVFESEEDQEWLRGTFAMLEDILMNTWAYKELREKAEQKGLEQGLEQGLEKGREDGLLKGAQETFLSMIKARFPKLQTLAQKVATSSTNYKQLQELTIGIALAANDSDAQQQLLAVLPATTLE